MQNDLYWAVGLLVAVVASAALLNRFNRGARGRVRGTLLLYAIYLLVLVMEHGLAAVGFEVWAGRFGVAAELLAAFTVVNIGATVLVGIALPAISTGVAIPMIATDLLVGLGYIVGTLAVLSTHGLNPTGALASAAVVSAVLAISLQSTLGNILGGVALQLDGSVHEGDWIQLADGKQGRVRAIRWRHTVVETRDWSTIIVPNAVLLANNIMILGKRDGKAVPARYWVWFNVDFRFPPARVIDVVSEALRSSPIDGVATDPPPNVVCMDFTKERRESFATYAARFWITDLAADDPTASRVRTRVYTALRRAEIPLAVPAQTAWVQIDDDTRAASKRTRKVDDRVAQLRHSPLFRGLTHEEYETLASGMSHAIYTEGELITRQGAVAHWLYLLTRGSVEIRMRVPNGRDDREGTKVIASLEAPDVFGEMGLMTGEARAADVVAVTDVECFRLGKETFERVLVERPEIAKSLSEKLAARRMELIAARDGLDESTRVARESMEADRILGGIKSFFGL